jgi:hypothetical protein
MNRLIIIGNGFDLAHGIKSSSKDLVLHYLSQVWEKLSTGNYKDRLVSIQRSEKYFRDNDINYSPDSALLIFKRIHKISSGGKDDAQMTIKSLLFKSIFNKIETLNWADFETEYFNELYDIIENYKIRKSNRVSQNRTELESYKNNKMISLNEDLDHLEDILVKYLKEQERLFLSTGKIDESYRLLFFEPIHKGGLMSYIKEESPKSVFFLNFNYTNTLSLYDLNVQINHIHGTLANNPIFGFGDDTSEKYSEIENEYNNEFLKKIKSFKYPNSNNYRNLRNFLFTDDYQVYIFGHSCGVSDRTLFKQIFENDLCKSIKIFYHNKNDFDNKKYEISRHFKDKISFLDKVLPFDFLSPMPQIVQNVK